jgi:GH25 family lysozyme M1 (1,4-beta-N-acetylmuramidase)
LEEEMTGIDISHYQAKMTDFAAAKTGGVCFAIIKATEGTTISDRSFATHYAGATAAGLPVGAYVFSHATTPEQAKAEAAFALHVIAGRPLPLGIYFDVETDKQMQLSNSQLQEVVTAFCTAIRAAGYAPGLYGSEYNLWAKISLTMLPTDVIRWVAHYGTRPAITCDLWQRSVSGHVDRYSGPVDQDVALSQRFELMVQAYPGEPEGDDQNVDFVVLALQSCMAHDGYWPKNKLDGVKTRDFCDKLLEYAQDVGRC